MGAWVYDAYLAGPEPGSCEAASVDVEETHRFQLAFWTRSPDEVSFSESREIQPDEQSPFAHAADVFQNIHRRCGLTVTYYYKDANEVEHREFEFEVVRRADGKGYFTQWGELAL